MRSILVSNLFVLFRPPQNVVNVPNFDHFLSARARDELVRVAHAHDVVERTFMRTRREDTLAVGEIPHGQCSVSARRKKRQTEVFNDDEALWNVVALFVRLSEQVDTGSVVQTPEPQREVLPVGAALRARQSHQVVVARQKTLLDDQTRVWCGQVRVRCTVSDVIDVETAVGPGEDGETIVLEQKRVELLFSALNAEAQLL